MKLETLNKLYINELRDLYNAENQLLKALPKMAKAASSAKLRKAFQTHLEQTEGHVERLEQVARKAGSSLLDELIAQRSPRNQFKKIVKRVHALEQIDFLGNGRRPHRRRLHRRV